MTHFQLLSIRDLEGRACCDDKALKAMPKILSFLVDVSMKQTVIMTDKMWERLPFEYRPIPWRQCIVVSKRKKYSLTTAKVVNSIEEAMKAVTTDYAYFMGSRKFLESAVKYCEVVYEVVVDSLFKTRKKAINLDPNNWSSSRVVVDEYKGCYASMFARNFKEPYVAKKWTSASNK